MAENVNVATNWKWMGAECGNTTSNVVVPNSEPLGDCRRSLQRLRTSAPDACFSVGSEPGLFSLASANQPRDGRGFVVW